MDENPYQSPKLEPEGEKRPRKSPKSCLGLWVSLPILLALIDLYRQFQNQCQ